MLSEQVIYYWNDELQYYYLAEKKNGSYKFVQPLKKLELDDISDPLEREQTKKMLEIKKRMSETKGNWF
ncbi:hypothetical protein ACUN18_28850 [Bacillus cereus group sp. Bce030]|uniref:Uncharacterized protein n=2 Tax=Bacillus thuringiensis TaxID=1428 RepID=A0A9X6LUZ9_BACTU|nr:MULTISPECIES: hypothetical protein [Bacillus cereus group]EJP82064.1 hypothetical protein IAU_05911 [Bacillus cereus IS075]EOO82008.1 hypothetical protein IGS_06010 [Bacillus cereus IS845/00]EOO91745.1 hypothetical protein IGQ_06018 [Bacillus cereus IS195]MEB9625867.1 hypothetical protein [Bacillus cereus]HDR5353879.1 hypothetical protein [Bacillus thuringiensis]